MNTYNNNTKFFNTGYISDENKNYRLKQGLDSQNISNLSLNYMIKNDQEFLPYFNTFWYPVKATEQEQSLPYIPNNSNCVKFLQPP